MTYDVSPLAVVLFVAFVGLVLGISFYFLVIAVLVNGVSLTPGEDFHTPVTLNATANASGTVTAVSGGAYAVVSQRTEGNVRLVLLEQNGIQTWWSVAGEGETLELKEALSRTTTSAGATLYNGAPREDRRFFQVGSFARIEADGQEVQSLAQVDPIQFLSIIQGSDILRFTPVKFQDGTDSVTVWYQTVTPGENLGAAGHRPHIAGDRVDEARADAGPHLPAALKAAAINRCEAAEPPRCSVRPVAFHNSPAANAGFADGVISPQTPVACAHVAGKSTDCPAAVTAQYGCQPTPNRSSVMSFL